MSLLLDALRPEPSAAATLPEEEPLEAHATLLRKAPRDAPGALPQEEPLHAHATLPEEEPLDAHATLPEEDPLDAHATLELLAPKLSANELLTLEPPADTATVAPATAVPH